MQASLQMKKINTAMDDILSNNIIGNYSFANNYQHSLKISSNSDFDLDQYIKKQKNIEKLRSFLELEDNWNGYGARPFQNELINKCINIINLSFIHYQPDIFPTGRNSIQFEYEKADGTYLEIEIYSDHLEILFIDAIGHEFELEDIKLEEVLQIINEFYA